MNMKRIVAIALLFCGLFLQTGAQQQPKPKPTAKGTTTVVSQSGKGPVKKDGTPDKRFKENKKLKKDGTPDKRFKQNKTNA